MEPISFRNAILALRDLKGPG